MPDRHVTGYLSNVQQLEWVRCNEQDSAIHLLLQVRRCFHICQRADLEHHLNIGIVYELRKHGQQLFSGACSAPGRGQDSDRNRSSRLVGASRNGPLDPGRPWRRLNVCDHLAKALDQEFETRALRLKEVSECPGKRVPVPQPDGLSGCLPNFLNNPKFDQGPDRSPHTRRIEVRPPRQYGLAKRRFGCSQNAEDANVSLRSQQLIERGQSGRDRDSASRSIARRASSTMGRSSGSQSLHRSMNSV